jgi:S-adenosylmethionine:tRNA ribosyltransferase-isomerase
MHPEYCVVPSETVEAIRRARAGGRVIAVGTTTARALEAAAAGGSLQPFAGETTLYITPGYRFKALDGLLTNFHMPRSTLLVLLCAFAGRENVLRAYREAVERRYRFLSFGDAMLVV